MHLCNCPTSYQSTQYKSNKCLFMAFYPLKFTHICFQVNYVKLGVRSDANNLALVFCPADESTNPDWPKQTEGWYSCYLKVPFNSSGSQASLRPLLTESTQPGAALQVINTLLTVVGSLLSSEQRTASWCTNSKQSQPADLEHKALVSRSPAISPPLSTIKVSHV